MPEHKTIVSTDARFKVDNADTWDAARDATSATADVPAYGGLKIATSTGPFDIYRYFAAWDTSMIPLAPGSATLKLHGHTATKSNNIRIMKVKSDAVGDSKNAFVDGDFDQIDWDTPYSEEFTATWINNDYNIITFNDAALSDMSLLEEFKIAIVAELDYDDDGTAASTKSGPYWRFLTTGTEAERPFITYDLFLESAASSSIGDNYIINVFNKDVLSSQYVRTSIQVPFVLGVPGPLSLRKRNTAPVTTLGSKKK